MNQWELFWQPVVLRMGIWPTTGHRRRGGLTVTSRIPKVLSVDLPQR